MKTNNIKNKNNIKNIRTIFIYNIIDMFMNRLYDSFIRTYTKYYNDFYNSVEYTLRNKYYKNKNEYNDIKNVILNFENEYHFDNFCCYCLNPKLNDVFIKLGCSHEMHYYCFKKFIKLNNNFCPFCKEDIKGENIKEEIKGENINKDKYYFKYEIKEMFYK